MTDVVGSTRLWSEHPEWMLAVMTRHHEILHDSVAAHGGWRPTDQGEGDAVFAAFESPVAAVEAALEFQQRLTAESWPGGIVIRDRVGIHIGEVVIHGGNLFGTPVNRTARIRSLGAGGQVLVSAPVVELAREQLGADVTVVDLGKHRMRDLDRPEHLFQVGAPGMESTFGPLPSLDLRRHNLPVQTSAFFGRTDELAETVARVRRERLVTLVGFGGTGKTRLAVHAAAELVAEGVFDDGVWFVDLATTEDPAEISAMIAGALHTSNCPTDGWEPLLGWLRERRLLLLLDNLEQLLPGAVGLLAELMSAAPGVQLLITSRTALHLRGEQIYEVPPLPVPTDSPGRMWTDGDLEELARVPAVALFMARASAVRRDFLLTAAIADAVVSISVLLEGLPLALELAAARVRVMSAEALLLRLVRDLSTLSGGQSNLPARQRTLRATIAWSVDALEPELAALASRCSVFPGSFTLESAEAIVGGDLDMFDAVAELVDRSLLVAMPDVDRFRLLVPVREFLAEALSETEHRRLLHRHLRFFHDLVLPPSHWVKARMEALFLVLPVEWHNVLSAIDTASAEGLDQDEVEITLAVHLWLQMSGRLGQARRLLDRARPAADRLGAVWSCRLVLAQAVTAEQSSERARFEQISSDVVERARATRDTSLLAYALAIRAGGGAESEESGREMLTEGWRLLDEITTGSTLPRWFVLDEWVRCASPYLPFREQVLAYWTEQAALAEGSERARYRANLAISLREAGRPAEALPLLSEYEQGSPPGDTTQQIRMFAPLEAAYCRILLDDPITAEKDVELARAAARAVDAPTLAVEIEFVAAAVDRMLGKHGDSEARLRRILHTSGAAEPEQRAAAQYLLSVLMREAGDVSEAATQLDQAWAGFPHEGLLGSELAQCLLEGAEQIRGSDPERALQLVAASTQLPSQRSLGWGVDYDVEQILDDLRGRLGSERVTAALANAGGSPLPLTITGSSPGRPAVQR